MSTIEKNVMASVYVIHMVRTLTSRLALACGVLCLSLIAIAMLVSVPHVMVNLLSVAHHGVVGIGTFVFSAVMGTRFIVQCALFIGTIAFLLVLIDLIRSISPIRVMGS